MIRKKILLVSLLCGAILGVRAQSYGDSNTVDPPLVTAHIAIRDTSNNSFFERHPHIGEVSMFYIDTLPDFLFVNFMTDGKADTKVEYYDLAFEGDVLLFGNKYGSLNLDIPRLRLSHVQVSYLNGTRYRKYNRVPVSRECNVLVSRDSVKYHFPEIDHPRRMELGMLAKYHGDIPELGTELTGAYADLKDLGNGVDSCLVFRVAVPKYVSNLQSAELVLGKRSAFSDWVKGQLLDKRFSWYPALISRGPIPSYLKVLVRLHPDGRITLSTPTKLRTLSGVLVMSQDGKNL